MSNSRKKVAVAEAGVGVIERRQGSKLVEAPSARDRRSDKARAIMAVSLDLFESRHFTDVSTKEIAAAAGVNSAMLYYYFDSKEELFRSVVEMTVRSALHHFHDLQENAKSPRDIISGWLETHIRQFDIIRKFVKISLNYRSSGAKFDKIDSAI